MDDLGAAQDLLAQRHPQQKRQHLYFCAIKASKLKSHYIHSSRLHSTTPSVDPLNGKREKAQSPARASAARAVRGLVSGGMSRNYLQLKFALTKSFNVVD
jgi:hypothetical protein